MRIQPDRPASGTERLLIPAALITALGNNIQLIAAALLMVRAEGTMLSVGWLFIAVAVPQAALSPLLGRVADRFDRRRLWLGCDLASAAAALAVPVWSAAVGPGSAVVYAGNFALAVVSALFGPASAGLVKERVRPAELRRFTADYEVATQAGMLLSASVGGFALQLFGATPLFVFNAATFLVSAACVAALGNLPTAAPSSAPSAPSPAAASPAAPVSGSSRGPVARLIVLYAQGSVVVTVFNALLPVLVIGELHRGAAVFGAADAAGGAGFLLAAVAYRALGRRTGDLRIAVVGFVAASLMMVLQPLFGVAGLVVFVALGAFLFGQARIASRTLLMTSVEEHRIGRVFGVAQASGLAATVVVMLAVSAITDHSDSRYGFAVLASLSAVAAVAAAGRRALRREPLPAEPPAEPTEPTEPAEPLQPAGCGASAVGTGSG
ncbi:MFS transporter [Kitasatospora sp. NPDC052868]|uniref:MFS transporter n=1 Tax=Kitasatospora sp. NPDC052868 TaxID=3364060 RepID=UPI0037CAA3B0